MGGVPWGGNPTQRGWGGDTQLNLVNAMLCECYTLFSYCIQAGMNCICACAGLPWAAQGQTACAHLDFMVALQKQARLSSAEKRAWLRGLQTYRL